MTDPEPDHVRNLIDAVNAGDCGADDALFEQLYARLRTLARGRLAANGAHCTLSPTELVHETFLRLTGRTPASIADSGHFAAIAARAMRRVLIEQARRRQALKRGADPLLTTLAEDRHGAPDQGLSADELVAVEQALTELERRDRRMARVVELRYFTGLSVAETARAMALSERSVHRLWQAARAWLVTHLDDRTSD